MQTKLTLKLDKDIIDKAKLYSKNQKKSLSKIVEDYLKIVVEKSDLKNESKISPIVKELTGIIDLSKLTDKDIKKDYTNFLLKKYE